MVDLEPKTVFVGLAIIIVFFLLIQSQTTEIVNNDRGCEGVWIEYEGHCCIDNNYNKVCDLLESQEIYNGKYFGNCKLTSDCSGGGEYGVVGFSGLQNICRQQCSAGKCVVSDCFVPGCITDDDCREDFSCKNYRCE